MPPPPPPPYGSALRRYHPSASLENLDEWDTPDSAEEMDNHTLHRRHSMSSLETRNPIPGSYSDSDDAAPTPNPRRTKGDKLIYMLNALRECRWSLGDFLYELFRPKDPKGNWIIRGRRHRRMIGRFLNGGTVARILTCWLEDPSGKPGSEAKEGKILYSLDVPYTELKNARNAITSCAAQLVRDEILREVRKAVQSESGLHGTGISAKGRKEISWADIGPNTLRDVMEIIKECQPLTWQLVKELVTPPARKRNGVLVVRKSRLPELTSTEIISTINFSRTNAARRLPAARAILYFACGAQQTLFTYGSRVGQLLSWKATCDLLRRLGAQTGAKVMELGQSDTKAGIIRFDNVQRWFKQREQRIGREDRMNIGVAATVAKMIDFDPAAFDLDEHLAKIRENKRKELKVDDFLQLLDAEHMVRMGELQWLETIVNIVLQLRKYKPVLANIRRTEGAKLRVPVHKTVVHPLGTVAKNEAVTVELRDALLDFLAQMGIKKGSVYKRRVVYVGGDGMSFEKSIVLGYYSQFQEDEVDSLVVIEPFLEIWHTAWTNLSSIFETHWGDPLTKDPSRLAHNAAKIGQKAPSNLKKVDFYAASFFTYLVLDARLLDCWHLHFQTDDLFSYFDHLEVEERLPSFEDLHGAAKELYKRYSDRHAYHSAMRGYNPADGLGHIPIGSLWFTPEEDETSRALPKPKGKGRSTKIKSTIEEPFGGDQTLAQSIMYMHVTMISREIAEVIADGDIGRVYEGLKYLLFTFAGFKHHPRYATLLLEQITRLEFESSPARKVIFLKNWLVNTAGEAGRFKAGDIMQEALNLVLEEMIRRNDMEWDTPRVCQVIAPNVALMNDLKNHWRDGLGLAPRRSKHPEPHSHPELRTLLSIYKTEELHMFRAGRFYDQFVDDVDTFTNGITKLRKGKLQKWVDSTTNARNLAAANAAQGTVQLDSIFNFEDDDEEGHEEDEEPLTAGQFS
ncbi:hypothetical protein NM688_g7020 [Phlebia brevispora]|uniref:Uncharacterized protein n=1 Tax=Phlebia brevispora TaxID=194682 RepID=A0ACC1S9Z8_9APHY|nr:hypothetical protein NM688_g7020 [Phlebia brevispora]